MFGRRAGKRASAFLRPGPRSAEADLARGDDPRHLCDPRLSRRGLRDRTRLLFGAALSCRFEALPALGERRTRPDLALQRVNLTGRRAPPRLDWPEDRPTG